MTHAKLAVTRALVTPQTATLNNSYLFKPSWNVGWRGVERGWAFRAVSAWLSKTAHSAHKRKTIATDNRK